jgi:hypothetical protein
MAEKPAGIQVLGMGFDGSHLYDLIELTTNLT